MKLVISMIRIQREVRSAEWPHVSYGTVTEVIGHFNVESCSILDVNELCH